MSGLFCIFCLDPYIDTEIGRVCMSVFLINIKGLSFFDTFLVLLDAQMVLASST